MNLTHLAVEVVYEMTHAVVRDMQLCMPSQQGKY